MMKTIEISQASRPLSDYVAEVEEPLVILRNGAPVAAVVSLAGEDFESLSLSTNEDFMALIERSRQQTREGDTLSLAEMRQRLGLAAE